MRQVLSFVAATALSAFVFSSCMKEEKPYALTPPPDGGKYSIEQKQVSIGEDYATQVYFSLTNGQVASSNYKVWDICFNTDPDASEMWMNGGKLVYIYPTGNTSFAAVTTVSSIAPATGWKYDNPSGLPGKSGLGALKEGNHIGEVLVVDGGEKTYYKLQILEVTPTQYKIKTGLLTATEGTEVVLERNTDYNYTYYSFQTGVVHPEPLKKDWDIQFTRYRHIYYNYGSDGKDFPYLVNGVLTNPYKTLSGDDSTKAYDFYAFNLDNANTFTLLPDRDVIGFDWKVADINDGSYVVKPKSIFLVQDQQGALWKLHFTGFYDSNGKKGSPSFEYQRLK